METRFRDTYNIGVQVTLMDSLELALRMLKQQLDTLGFKVHNPPQDQRALLLINFFFPYFLFRLQKFR